MSLRLGMAFAIGLALAGFVKAADPPKPQDTAEVLNVLFDRKVELDLDNVNNVSLFDLLNQLTQKYKIGFSINEESFKVAGGQESLREKKPNVQATNIRDLSIHQFLLQVLDSLGATYIIKGDVVEIVTVAHAARVAKAAIDQDANGNLVMKEPLICAIIKQTTLNDSIGQLASRYDLSVSISPLVIQGPLSPVSARLLNLPADKAIEMLALQCDLRVVRKGNAYLITTRENAKTLLAEHADQERQKIELEMLRAGSSVSTVAPQRKADSLNLTEPKTEQPQIKKP
jgi:hypothetical protein